MLAGTAAAVLGAALLPAAGAIAAAEPAPLVRATAKDAVKDSYIVVLKDGTSAKGLASAAKRAGGKVTAQYDTALKGYSATLTSAQLADVRADSAVEYVEQNRRYQREELDRNTVPARGAFSGRAAGTVGREATQTSPWWGLDRVDQRTLPINNKYQYGSAGKGVTAYVIDDGVSTTHADFAGPTGSRVVGAFNATNDGHTGEQDCSDTVNDEQAEIWGHGTFVAGILAGGYSGVAKESNIVNVRVFECPTAANPDPDTGATTADIVKGVDWVATDHADGEKAVANMSLGGSPSQAIDDAVNRLIADGVPVFAAAGNYDPSFPDDPWDACAYSPGRVPGAITVGATWITRAGEFDETGTTEGRDTRYSFYGPCVDVFAPGTNIFGPYFMDDEGAVVGSGTSMATPAAAGVGALYQATHTNATPAQVSAAIIDASTRNTLKDVGAGSKNRLLFSQLADKPAQTDQASKIVSGKGLNLGTSIKSPNGLYTLTFQNDGNLVLTKPGGRVLWATNVRGTWAKVNDNGNFVVYDYGRVVWNSGVTSGPGEVRLQDDGNIVSYRASNNASTWASKTAQRIPPPQISGTSDTAQPGTAIYRNQRYLQSGNGRYRAYLRGTTGKFVVRDLTANRDAFFTNSLDSDWVSIQGDGNVVVYRSNGTALWSTGTGGRGAARLVMQNDGNLVLYRGGTALWSSKGGRS